MSVIHRARATATADLASFPLGDGPVPLAGLPRYVQLFGRNTLSASWQALIAMPELLRDELKPNGALARPIPPTFSVGTRWR